MLGGVGRGSLLASLCRGWSSQALPAAFTASFSAEAVARTAEQPSTSGRAAEVTATKAPAKDGSGSGGRAKPGAGAPAAADTAAQERAAATAAAAAESYIAPARLSVFAQHFLQRELMLKLGPRSWDALPRLTSIEATIRSSETNLERDVVEKWELLLHSLALEVLTGRPATFTAAANKHLTTRAGGVSVKLDALTDPDAAYGFLEKLVYVLLPNQVGFEGVPPPQLYVPPRRDPGAERAAARRAVADHRKDPLRPHWTEFKVQNLLSYPDFEEQFSLFEPLAGVRLRVRLGLDAARAEHAAALLSGLSVPVLGGAAAEAALEELRQEALRARRG
ncbi:hypothetical protein HYH03_004015 [Edaphochlamys debaryana]|uniref:Uncharacterized protein n=1 Tax=Edaphochlamys debaryana TaxID=47281 RepID=A0A836C2Q5_9CHLO|nr:hypothetical protein HYH03_004015 [Edaphochlamys debaryana]|eukprot:KAG2498266.1 hypothetical protein HYH03_004015 [Edaphochlamys debaryana]